MRTVKEISDLTGISVRTLHYYDEIGLLKPTEKSDAGYRLYDDKALETLQQILFFREFDISLKEIKAVLDNPALERNQILQVQRKMLVTKKERMERLIASIDDILKGENKMDFTIFTKTEVEEMFQTMLEHMPENMRNIAIKEFGSEKRKELLAEKAAEEAVFLPNLLMKYMEVRKAERSDWTRAGQNRGTSKDLKAVSEALSYLQRKGLSTVEDLENFIETSGKSAADYRKQMKPKETRSNVIDATDRVEGNMRRGAAAAANSSRRMIKRYREKQRQGKEYVKQIYKTGGAATVESDPHNPAAQYDNLSPSTSVRSEAGSYPLESSQDAEATPPRERGRQKAVQDAKTAYRRHLAEKRTAERCIAPPQPNCSGAMATPQKGNQGTSVKSDPVPKNGRPLAGASRTMRVRQVARTTQSETIIARRARAAAQRKAQWAMLRDATKDNGNTAKKLSRTAVQAVKTVGKGVASAGNSILTAGGGAAVLVLLLMVILVAAIVASPFGILLV